MFKHLLVPTDGSALSENAALKSLALARALGARVTALHVSPEFHSFTYRTDLLEDTRDAYERHSAEQAQRYLRFVSAAATRLGVQCGTLHQMAEGVAASVVAIAAEAGCDAIAMASHGRRGIAGLLLGSQTQHVLTHSSLPVVVWR